MLVARNKKIFKETEVLSELYLLCDSEFLGSWHKFLGKFIGDLDFGRKSYLFVLLQEAKKQIMKWFKKPLMGVGVMYPEM